MRIANSARLSASGPATCRGPEMSRIAASRATASATSSTCAGQRTSSVKNVGGGPAVDRVGDVLLQRGQRDRAVEERRADHDRARAERHDGALGVDLVAGVVDQRERLVGLDVRGRPAGEDDVGRHVDEACPAGLGGLGDVLAGVDDRAAIGLAVGEVGDRVRPPVARPCRARRRGCAGRATSTTGR